MWVPGIHSRRDEGDGAGSNGNVDLGVVEVARAVGEVGGDLDGGFLDGGFLGEEEACGEEDGGRESEGAGFREGHVREETSFGEWGRGGGNGGVRFAGWLKECGMWNAECGMWILVGIILCIGRNTLCIVRMRWARSCGILSLYVYQ